eukprot:COSAG06_NODE_16457_length_1000_cov_1.860155_2_plen_55_part_00
MLADRSAMSIPGMPPATVVMEAAAAVAVVMAAAAAAVLMPVGGIDKGVDSISAP